MNDYLSTLAARSFDLSEAIGVVRPRLPSLFEPAPEDLHGPEETFASSVRNGLLEDGEGNDSRSTDSGAPVRVNPGFETPQELDGRSARLRGDGERTPLHPAGSITANEDQPVPLARDPIDQIRAHYESNGQAASIARDPVIQARAQYESRGDDRAQSREKASELSVSPTALRSEPPGRLAGQLSPSPMSPAPDTRSERDEHSGSVSEQLTDKPERVSRKDAVRPVPMKKVRLVEPVQRMVDLELPLTRKEGEDQEPEAARSAPRSIEEVLPPREEMTSGKAISKLEPTINVTIGRVEVRAVMPNKVEKRKAARGAMSLDEYLARRTGGRS